MSQLDTAVYPCALSYLIFSQTSRLTGSNPAVQLELRTVWKYCVQPRPSSVSSACFLSLSPAELIMRSTCCLLLHQHHKWFSLSNAARGFFKWTFIWTGECLSTCQGQSVFTWMIRQTICSLNQMNLIAIKLPLPAVVLFQLHLRARTPSAGATNTPRLVYQFSF